MVKLRALCKSGAERLSSVNSEGWTALQEAAFGGHVESVRVLLDHGADVCALNEARARSMISFTSILELRQDTELYFTRADPCYRLLEITK